jgi:hypothetical protein
MGHRALNNADKARMARANASAATLAPIVRELQASGVISYDDLIELARLCLKQAAATSHPATAARLRLMADEYQARAQALADEPRLPDTAAAVESTPQGAQPSQQQQQPQANGPPGSKEKGVSD